jgi:ATP-dependent Clp protease ATP-binding subunit ClpA
MFERFTTRARHAVVLAQEEARRLHHNYIGTEHMLLGLLGEPGGVAFQALERFGMSLEGTRQEVTAIVGTGTATVSGHIPFTPRAKKTLELALREALHLHHNYIGTEHILLGVMGEGDGVGAQILKQHSPDLTPVRMAVLDVLSTLPAGATPGRGWLRRRFAAGPGEETEAGEAAELRTTPAADTSLSEAARLAGSQPVGSHHLLLAALGDPDSAAARALAGLGLDLDQARNALRTRPTSPAPVTSSQKRPADARC